MSPSSGLGNFLVSRIRHRKLNSSSFLMVQVSQQFRGGTDVTNMRLLLFDHSKQVARIRIQDGAVVQVDLEDV